MSTLNAVSFSTKFSLNTTPKKFIFTDTTDYTGVTLADVYGVFSIVGPTGDLVYANTNFAAADIHASVSLLNTTTIPLPLNSNGDVVAGDYVITYSVKIASNTPIYITPTVNTYTYSYVAPVVEITQSADCLRPLFTSTDDTAYTVDSIIPSLVRTHTISFPTNPVTTIGGVNATYSTATFYNGIQTTNISTVATYLFADGLTVVDTIVGFKSAVVDCTFVCEIYCCLRSLYNNVENNRGVNTVLFNKYSETYSQVMDVVQQALLSISCGKSTETSGYVAKIKLLANCTDDCSCSDTEPKLVVGLGSIAGDVVTVTGTSPVIVTPTIGTGTRDFVVSFDGSQESKLLASYNTVVAAGTNVTIGAPAIVGDVRTYTVNATVSAAQNRSEWVTSISFSANGTPTVAAPSMSLISGANMANVGNISIAATSATLSDNNNFLVSGFQIAPNQLFNVVASIINGTALTSEFYGINLTTKASGSFNINFRPIGGPRPGVPTSYTGLANKTFIINFKISA